MKRQLLNIPHKEIANPIFIREKKNHLRIYIIDEVEYEKFKKYQEDGKPININCIVLEYLEEENKLVYSLKKPTTMFPISSDKVELMMVGLEG